MGLPSGLTTIVVTGTYVNAAGTPLTGQVNFMLTVPVKDATGEVILGPGTVPAPLNGSGSFSVTLPCTDNADLNPVNFTYLVTEVIPGLGRAYSIALPHTLGATVDLSQISPVSPAPAASAFASANTWTATQTFSGNPALKITTGAVNGDVLTSDASGNATWQAPSAGFTNPMSALGDMISGGTAGAAARLAGNTTSAKEFLTSTGTGSAANAPAWAGITAGDLPAATTSAQGAVILDGTASDIQPSPGVGAAGSKGQAADARHVHPYEPWQFYVQAYGAAGNCKIVTDGAMSSSASPTHLTCATSAPFTSGDVGKSVTVTGAGAAGAPLTTTIASFTDSAHVTLTAAASTTVSGATVTYGTDDTAAVNSALAAAYAYAVANHGYAEILFDPVTYLIAGATSTGTLGTSGQCKAQIPLPVTATTAQKITLVFRGTRDASALYHWQQTTPQAAGAVLATTLNANAGFGVIGTEPSVIGGPLPANGYGAGSSLFANDLIVIDGITILTPNNPLICGFDFRGMAEANVISASVMVNTGGGLVSAITVPTQGNQFALAMPEANNNDNCNVQMFSCEGQNYGLIASEHTVVWSMRAIWCVAGLVCSGGSGSSTPHSMLVHYVSVEACQIGLQLNYVTASPTKLRILNLDFESGSGGFALFNVINDPGNYGTGEVCVSDIGAATPRTSTFNGNSILNGGSGLQIRALDLPLGHITAPSVPSTTTALLNGSGANAAVTVTAGTATITAITVDGTAAGITSGTVIVPSNKTIALTYSGGTPAWTWVLF